MQFNQLYTHFQDYYVAQSWQFKPTSLYEPISYAMEQTGKHMRPMLCLMSYATKQEQIDLALPAAYAIELFHNFTLVHDDIMDKAILRRNRNSVPVQFSESAAILSGDAMLIHAWRYMLESAHQHARYNILDLFNRAGIEVCEGQAMDMAFEKDTNVTYQDYKEMIRLKTSVLLAYAMQIGATLAKHSDADGKAFFKLGESIGNAFQIQDDYLDYYGESGKTKGGDILQCKKSILYWETLEYTHSQEHFKDLYQLSQINSIEKLQQVDIFFKEVNLKSRVEDQIDNAYNTCNDIIAQLPITALHSNVFKQLIQQLKSRLY